MKNKLYLGVAILALLFLLSKPITADFQSEEDKTIQVADSLLKSTVIITVQGGGGSGFFIGPHEVVTNRHVINDAKSVFIKKSNGTMCIADVVFTQTNPDLALLRTECEGKPITLAESVKVGQSVLVMGNPIGYEFNISKGVVGSLNRGELVHDAITDQGSSGGPIIDLNGQLVGVSQAISKSTRLSFAIDIPTLSYFLYQAKEE